MEGMEGFEWFDPALGAPSVSIAEYGMTFNKGAVDLLRDAQRIMFGFNKDTKMIAIRPLTDFTEEEEKRSFAFAEKKRDGYVRIASKEFVRFIGRYLETTFEKTIRYLAVWDDEKQMMFVDLNKPIESTSSE